nr:hypothetical protein [Microbacterium testaceum]
MSGFEGELPLSRDWEVERAEFSGGFMKIHATTYRAQVAVRFRK